MPPAFEVLLLNTAVPQIQAAQAGDTYVVPRDIAFSAALTLSAGTANGVPYLNGSKVLTSGSALTFDGTTLNAPKLTTSVTSGMAANWNAGANDNQIYGQVSQSLNNFQYGIFSGGTAFLASGNNYPLAFFLNSSEQMRLTSTGLGIGTSSPGYKLDVAGSVIRLINSGATADLFLTDSGTTNGYVRLRGESNAMKFITGNGVSATIDSSGNLGLGVTPKTDWSAVYDAFQLGGGSSLSGHTSTSLNFTILASNQYVNTAGTSKFINDGYAPRYLQRGDTGEHYWYTTNNGLANGDVVNTQALTLDANRNLLLNGTSAGASAVGTLAIFNGTAPTGSVTDGIILYAEDVSSSSELKVRDEAGNVTTLSPHNFSLIPEGPSEDMAWAYYSEKGGKRINVDMLKLARMVEKLTGEKLVYEA